MAPNQAIVPEAADIAVVTGASGYLATELINQLLSKGYNVRGTVRSLTNQDKTEHLRKLNEVSSTSAMWTRPDSTHVAIMSLFFTSTMLCLLRVQALPGNLTLYEADLMKKGSFDGVMKVCCWTCAFCRFVHVQGCCNEVRRPPMASLVA